MGLLLRVARAKVGFLAGVASGRYSSYGEGSRHGTRKNRRAARYRWGVKRGNGCEIDGSGG